MPRFAKVTGRPPQLPEGEAAHSNAFLIKAFNASHEDVVVARQGPGLQALLSAVAANTSLTFLDLRQSGVCVLWASMCDAAVVRSSAHTAPCHGVCRPHCATLGLIWPAAAQQ